MMTMERPQPRVIRVDRPERHYCLLRAPDGTFIRTRNGAALETSFTGDDTVIWDRTDNGFIHVVTGLRLQARCEDDRWRLERAGKAVGADGRLEGEPAEFTLEHGPSQLPSEYLTVFREQGWVCLASILSLDLVLALQQVTASGQWEGGPFDAHTRPLLQSSAVAKAAVEPVSLWLMRSYLGTKDIRLSHGPQFTLLDPYKGDDYVLAWHSDAPYLWGISYRNGITQVPMCQSADLVLGIQRNVCVTDFTYENGATLYKLGSHREGKAPPVAWGRVSDYDDAEARQRHGLPYSGADVDVVEAPAGSVILFDARTWHRAGVNRTPHRRSAITQAVIPGYIMPMTDTGRLYRSFLRTPLAKELDSCQLDELQDILVHRLTNAVGRFAIRIDPELTEMIRGPEQ